MDDQMNEILKTVSEDAEERERASRRKTLLFCVTVICLTVVLSILAVCATFFAVTVFQEQQWALNMQFSEVVDTWNDWQYIDAREGVYIEGDHNQGNGTVGGE